MSDNRNIAILGASSNTERYAWMAQQLLRNHDYVVMPVSPVHSKVGDIATYTSLTTIIDPIHTVTVYVNPRHVEQYVDQLLQVKPQRVIFNPGSENPVAIQRLRDAGIQVELACTLVLLRTWQF